MSKVNLIDKSYLKTDLPEFRVGDEVKIHLKVKEGDKTRTQLFTGIVIRKRGSGISASFTVLKEVRGDMVEKTFPTHSPSIEKIVVGMKGKAHRAKLYHLRKKHSQTAS